MFNYIDEVKLMSRLKLYTVFFLALIFCLGCDILSPPESSLSGTWDCSLFGITGPSSATMKLKDKNGRLSGTFQWNDINLPIDGTVNSKRQVNMETQDPTHLGAQSKEKCYLCHLNKSLLLSLHTR